jgi:hypothetical protein
LHTQARHNSLTQTRKARGRFGRHILTCELSSHLHPTFRFDTLSHTSSKTNNYHHTQLLPNNQSNKHVFPPQQGQGRHGQERRQQQHRWQRCRSAIRHGEGHLWPGSHPYVLSPPHFIYNALPGLLTNLFAHQRSTTSPTRPAWATSTTTRSTSSPTARSTTRSPAVLAASKSHGTE